MTDNVPTKKMIVVVLIMFCFITGCVGSAHGISINKPSRVEWSGDYEGLFVDAVSVLVNETAEGQVYVVIRGEIENASSNKTFIDLSIGAELRATDGSLGGENHLRGPNTVFKLRPGQKKSFEIRIDDPAKGRYEIIFVIAGISYDELKNEDPLINTAEGGSLLITGSTIDDNKEIKQPETTFKANEDFYLYFNNNDQFGTDRVIVQLINSVNDQVLAESEYDVEPESNTITDMIWFGSSGRYQIKVIVDGEVRAVREVVVE